MSQYAPLFAPPRLAYPNYNRYSINIPPRSGGYFRFGHMPNPKNAKLHSLWQESQCDFADTTWRRTSTLKVGLPAAQQILATRQRVVKIFALLKSNALFNAFLREGSCAVYGTSSLLCKHRGGTRMRDGRSLRAPRFSLALLQLLFPSYALSLSRLRRQLPPGGSLSTKHSALFACLLSPHRQ